MFIGCFHSSQSTSRFANSAGVWFGGLFINANTNTHQNRSATSIHQLFTCLNLPSYQDIPVLLSYVLCEGPRGVNRGCTLATTVRLLTWPRTLPSSAASLKSSAALDLHQSRLYWVLIPVPSLSLSWLDAKEYRHIVKICMDSLEKDIRNGQLVPPECPARVPGVLTYRKQHLHAAFHFGLRL